MDPTAPNTGSVSGSSSGYALLQHNETLLTRDMILTLLADLSTRLYALFRSPIRLIVHGGAAMLLHPGLYAQPGCERRDTRDIDYIHRSFVDEWRQLGVPDAGERLQSCIDATARKFQLGRDWMNAHADIALPMATDPQGRQYDPIYTASLKSNNVHLHTLYSSPGLVLISVTPFWAVALKLVRYQKHDAADITAILRNGTRLNGVRWSVEVLERWLRTECWAMGYENYPDWLKRDMCERIAHAVAQLNADTTNASSSAVARLPSHDKLQPDPHSRMPSLAYPIAPHYRPHSSLAAPPTLQAPSAFTEPSHRRLRHAASTTFAPPKPHLALTVPPPLPPPPHQHQHHAQPITRAHTLPVPMLSIPSPTHLIIPHPRSASSQTPSMHSSQAGPASTPSLLLAPAFHFSQQQQQQQPTTASAATAIQHLSPTRAQQQPSQPSQSHSRTHSQSHWASLWSHGNRQAVLPPFAHTVNWPGQLSVTAH